MNNSFYIQPQKVGKELITMSNVEQKLYNIYEQLDSIKTSLSKYGCNNMDLVIGNILMDINKEKKIINNLTNVLKNCLDSYNSFENKIALGSINNLIGYKSNKIADRRDDIDRYAKQWDIDIGSAKWDNMDIIKWKTTGGDDYLFEQKEAFVKTYSDVIKDAAEKYNIPPFLLAGIVYSEYGGDPLWVDNLAYSFRSFDWSGPDWMDENMTISKNPDLTSFGNVSMQVRRAAETLGYDIDTMTASEKKELIKKLEDPVTNIYIVAAHVSDLRDIDYKGIDGADLTEEQIVVIGTRYNRGPDLSLDEIKDNTSYGDSMYKHEKSINSALGD